MKDTVEESLWTIHYYRDWDLKRYRTKYRKNPRSLQSTPGENHIVPSVRRTLILCVHWKREKRGNLVYDIHSGARYLLVCEPSVWFQGLWGKRHWNRGKEKWPSPFRHRSSTKSQPSCRQVSYRTEIAVTLIYLQQLTVFKGNKTVFYRYWRSLIILREYKLI